jgi:hypothetical protein
VKVGDLVRNVGSVRTNDAVNEIRGWTPVSPGHVGVVLDVRPDTLNNPPLFDYVDVMLSVDGCSVPCGNYAATIFEVIT